MVSTDEIGTVAAFAPLRQRSDHIAHRAICRLQGDLRTAGDAGTQGLADGVDEDVAGSVDQADVQTIEDQDRELAPGRASML